MRSIEDAQLYALGLADGGSDGFAAGESEGWEAGYEVARTGTAAQER
jgi:hypothetical protein